MTKNEFIAKYGEAAYEEDKLRARKWAKDHKEQCKQLAKKWKEEHKEQCKQLKKKCYEKHKEQYNQSVKKWKEEHKEQYKQSVKKWKEDRRINGCTAYCTKNYELIENYELAKADNFNHKKWHLHHRLENYWSKSTLKRKGLYYGVNPEALIWLPYEEHMKDRSCKNSKWHKRSLENE